MRFDQGQHRFYCGIDLHARSMYLCILDQAGAIVYHQNLAAETAPFRDDLVVCCECLFAWYWLADLCAAENIPFVLGHALYLKAIHGGETKNDKIDARKIATLLRGGAFPVAYDYPRAKRATRDLLRRRSFFVRQRATGEMNDAGYELIHPGPASGAAGLTGAHQGDRDWGAIVWNLIPHAPLRRKPDPVRLDWLRRRGLGSWTLTTWSDHRGCLRAEADT